MLYHVVNWDTMISVSKIKINNTNTILKSIIQGLLQLYSSGSDGANRLFYRYRCTGNEAVQS